MTVFSLGYIERLNRALCCFPHLEFEELAQEFLRARDRKSTIFVMGNGGSGATASHWVCDVNKGCSYGQERRFRMICLNDNMATMLAYGNDVEFDCIFVEQLRNFLEPEDVVIAISGSGNSRNVLRAIEYANDQGAVTFGLVGYGGGQLKGLVQRALHLPVDDMQIVEDAHMITVHMLLQRLMPQVTVA